MTVAPVYDTVSPLNDMQWLHPLLFDEGWITLPTEILGLVPVEIAVPDISGMPLQETSRVVENQWRQALAETFGTFPDSSRYWLPGPESGLRSELRELYTDYAGRLSTHRGIGDPIVSLTTCSEAFAPWRVISTWCSGCTPYNNWVLAPLRFMWSRTADNGARYWAPEGVTTNQSTTASLLHLGETQWYEAIRRAWKIHESNSGITEGELLAEEDEETHGQIEQEFVNEINVATVLAHHDLWSWTDGFSRRLEEGLREHRPVQGLSADWVAAITIGAYEESRTRLRWKALSALDRQREIDTGIAEFREDGRRHVA